MLRSFHISLTLFALSFHGVVEGIHVSDDDLANMSTAVASESRSNKDKPKQSEITGEIVKGKGFKTWLKALNYYSSYTGANGLCIAVRTPIYAAPGLEVAVAANVIVGVYNDDSDGGGTMLQTTGSFEGALIITRLITVFFALQGDVVCRLVSNYNADAGDGSTSVLLVTKAFLHNLYAKHMKPFLKKSVKWIKGAGKVLWEKLGELARTVGHAFNTMFSVAGEFAKIIMSGWNSAFEAAWNKFNPSWMKVLRQVPKNEQLLQAQDGMLEIGRLRTKMHSLLDSDSNETNSEVEELRLAIEELKLESSKSFANSFRSHYLDALDTLYRDTFSEHVGGSNEAKRNLHLDIAFASMFLGDWATGEWSGPQLIKKYNEVLSAKDCTKGLWGKCTPRNGSIEDVLGTEDDYAQEAQEAVQNAKKR